MNLFKVYADDAPTITVPRPKGFRMGDLGSLISSAVSAMLIISAILAFVFLVLGGIQWITSGGDKAGMEAARNKITHAIVGLIVVAAAYAIMILVSNFLGISFLDNGFTIGQPNLLPAN